VKSRVSPVRAERPKRLTGRDQNGAWVGPSRFASGRRHPMIPTGVEAPTQPIHILLRRQLGKPYAPHHGGIPTARPGDGAEGK
jgi:hypothetical protein